MMNHLLILIWLSGLAIIGSNLNARISTASSRAEHCVRKVKFVLTDRNRGEWFTQDSTDFRKIAVTVWYPATCQSENDSPYIDARILQAYAESMFPDSTDFSRLTAVQNQAIEKAQTARIGKRPVIIFSPGSKTHVEMYTFLLRELAASGYFVFAVSHFYSTPLTLPDGTFVPRNQKAGSKPESTWTDGNSEI